MHGFELSQDGCRQYRADDLVVELGAEFFLSSLLRLHPSSLSAALYSMGIKINCPSNMP